MKQILPQLPILSSSKQMWEGIRAEHLHELLRCCTSRITRQGFKTPVS
ncbi:MAG TPA: hypothetical protein V6D48_13395 [Oculatellaceae cyanobacterium]